MSAGYNYCRARERRSVALLKKAGLVLTFSGTRRKLASFIIFMSLLTTIPLASAHLASPVYSAWTTNIPTIDGTMSPGEWTDAAVRDFTLDMRDRTWGLSYENLSARFYVKNDENNIYAAVQIFDEDYDAANFIAGWDRFGLLFDDDHSGDPLVDGDNGEGFDTYAGPPPAAWYENNDLYWNSSANTWLADVGVGGTEDGEIVWSHSDPVEEHNGTYTIEMWIPLVGSDGDGYDLDITSLPWTLGFKIWFFENDEAIDGVYPDDPGTGKNVLETKNADTFGNLVLAKRPPPPPVGGIAAPIVIQIKEPNLLTPLIWLASAIMCPIALTAILVKLKKKK